jgi:uncharacterized protein YjiK
MHALALSINLLLLLTLSARAYADEDSTSVHLGSYDLESDPVFRWKLPDVLAEISGLAMTTDGRLLTHNDEVGLVFDVDFEAGAILKKFRLSDVDQTVADDFEGIAVAEGRVYLTTSAGRIYEFREGDDGDRVLYDTYGTGIGRSHEIEGLAYDPRQRALVLVSKNPRTKDGEGQVVVYRWSIDTKRLGDQLTITVADFARHLDGDEFQPSGIEVHPASGNYYLVAARQSAIAEITPDGEVLAARHFAKKQHRQTEGITFLKDSTLAVSDEGAGKRARLTLYRADR